MTTSHRISRDAINTIDAALNPDSPDCDLALELIRDELIAPEFPNDPNPITDAIRTIRDSSDIHLTREYLTHLALSLSLCPIHLIDYAICFDDDDAECAQIRQIHPTHDT